MKLPLKLRAARRVRNSGNAESALYACPTTQIEYTVRTCTDNLIIYSYELSLVPVSGMAELTPVLVALGSNLGKPESYLVQALQQLAKELEVDALSSLYRSEPVGYATQPDFLNSERRRIGRFPGPTVWLQGQMLCVRALDAFWK